MSHLDRFKRLIRLANDLRGRTKRTGVKTTGLKGNITKSLHTKKRLLNRSGTQLFVTSMAHKRKVFNSKI